MHHLTLFRGEGHYQAVAAVILFSYNLRIRLTRTQINHEYYVSLQSHLADKSIFTLLNGVYTMSPCLLTHSETHALERPLLMRWDAFARAALVESWLQTNVTASTPKLIQPDLATTLLLSCRQEHFADICIRQHKSQWRLRVIPDVKPPRFRTEHPISAVC